MTALAFIVGLMVPTLDAASVSLTWEANGESDVTGYRMYQRRLPSADFGSPNFSGLPNNPAFPQLRIKNLFEDSSYAFIATAVDSAGNESSPSKKARITITGNATVVTSGGVSDIPQEQMRVVSVSSNEATQANVLDGVTSTVWPASDTTAPRMK